MTANPQQPEPRNPFYLLLLIASLFFVVTALSYAVMPMLEEKAADAGRQAPTSAIRRSLQKDGWKWLLIELAAMIVLGLASMILDRARLRRLKSKPEHGKMPTQSTNESSTPKVTEPDHVGNPKGDRQAAQGDRSP